MMLTLIVFNNTTTLRRTVRQYIYIPLGISARYVLRTHKTFYHYSIYYDLLVKQFTNYNFEAVLLGNMSHDPRGDYLDIGLSHKTSTTTVNRA